MDKHTFGYYNYQDAYDNGVRLTVEEFKSLKDGDEVLILITNDSDDYYTLKNRLHLVQVEINDISIGVDGFTFYFEDGIPEHEGACLIKPKNSEEYVLATFTNKETKETKVDKFLEFADMEIISGSIKKK